MKKFIQNIRNKARGAAVRTTLAVDEFVSDRKGDLSTNTIGAIIIGILIIGILVAAINTFFGDFFEKMFDAMQDKFDLQWGKVN